MGGFKGHCNPMTMFIYSKSVLFYIVPKQTERTDVSYSWIFPLSSNGSAISLHTGIREDEPHKGITNKKNKLKQMIWYSCTRLLSS